MSLISNIIRTIRLNNSLHSFRYLSHKTGPEYPVVYGRTIFRDPLEMPSNFFFPELQLWNVFGLCGQRKTDKNRAHY